MGICKFSADHFKPSYIEYVYSLRSPLTYDIFYVGKTRSLSNRLGGHIGECRKELSEVTNPDKVAIIKEILKAGLRPIMRVIDITKVRTKIDEYHAAYKEVKWILFYNEIGWNLTNKRDINAILSKSDYIIKYRDIVNNKKPISLSLYSYGVDNENNKIFDLKRLKVDGYEMPKDETKREEWDLNPGYNPWKNPRFLQSLGEDNPYQWETTTLDYEVYKDTDPDYYEQGDCFFFY